MCECVCSPGPNDEAHNIIHPRRDVLDNRCVQLVHRFGRRLWHAENAVVVLFTATPVVQGRADATHILRLTKGRRLVDRGDEGFVSWYMERPSELFARAEPDPRGLPRVTWVPIDGGDPVVGSTPTTSTTTEPPAAPAAPRGTRDPPSAFFREYAQRRFGKRSRSPSPGGRAPDPPRCLPPAPTPAGGGGSGTGGRAPVCKESWAAFETQRYWWAHERAHHGRLKGLREAREWCPKLAAIAESIATDPAARKTVVLIHHENGLRTLVHLLGRLGVSVVQAVRVKGQTGSALRTARAQNLVTLAAFNDAEANVRGERHRVFVAPAEEFSEGVSFRNVRRIVLADLSPGLQRPQWSLVKQRVARALRTCSHTELPVAERELAIDLFVACHHQPRLPPTIDQEKLEAVAADMRGVEAGMAHLRDRSLDAAYYAAAARGPEGVAQHLGRLHADQWFLRTLASGAPAGPVSHRFGTRVRHRPIQRSSRGDGPCGVM